MNIRNLYTQWYNEMRKKAVKEFINNISGEKILDIGAGEGIFNEIFRQVGFKKLVAVDFNEKILKINDADENK